MKSAALLVVLLLHLTGLWQQVPAGTRSHLDQTAAGQPVPERAAQTTSREPITAIPVQLNAGQPAVAAGSAYAIDTATHTVLAAQNATQKRPIASVTKLVTCLVILSRHSTDEIVTVPALPAYGPEDEVMGLVPGEKYRLGDLVTAALVQSANDAAEALAIFDAGSTAKFAARMNAKMAAWGITGTRFSTPSGLQDQDNYATAEALGNIAMLALANPDIRSMVRLTNATISSQSGRVFSFTNTNKLLASGAFYGIKTGYTLAAGECFVGLTRINGHEVVTVVLGATDRFGASQQLAGWITQSWQWF
jgi:D-alanyl-D-alanine carboxypeptidase (penicillin-binding protein 5/6)